MQIHPEAIPAAIAAECANKQGKYWQMHDALFENHKKLNEETLYVFGTKIGLKLTTLITVVKTKQCMTRLMLTLNMDKV